MTNDEVEAAVAVLRETLDRLGAHIKEKKDGHPGSIFHLLRARKNAAHAVEHVELLARDLKVVMSAEKDTAIS